MRWIKWKESWDDGTIHYYKRLVYFDRMEKPIEITYSEFMRRN
jgi:hypothetical protein